MSTLILGLILFFGAHVFSTLRGPRAAAVARFGEQGYKLGYALLAALGLALIVWGFGRYRHEGMIPVWDPPLWTRHLTILLMWPAFVALAASGRRPSRIRGLLRHPMLVGVKIWALAHLLANGDLGGMILFGSFLAFAAYDRVAVKRRGDAGAPRLDAFVRADAVILASGSVAYVLMIVLHPYVIGVSVFG